MDCIIIVAYEIDTRLRLIYHFSTEILLFKYMQSGLSREVSRHLGGEKCYCSSPCSQNPANTPDHILQVF